MEFAYLLNLPLCKTLPICFSRWDSSASSQRDSLVKSSLAGTPRTIVQISNGIYLQENETGRYTAPINDSADKCFEIAMKKCSSDENENQSHKEEKCWIPWTSSPLFRFKIYSQSFIGNCEIICEKLFLSEKFRSYH